MDAPPHKDTRFELRCSREELVEWRALAKTHGVSLSRYVRSCLGSGPRLRKICQADPALVRQIAAFGNNLNQLSRWANTYKSSQDAFPVERELRRIRKALEYLARSGRNHADQGLSA